MSFIQKIREKSTPKIQKNVYLVLAAFTTLMAALLAFTPFCIVLDEVGIAQQKIQPYNAFALLRDDIALADGSAYLSLVLFLLWLAYVVFAGYLLVKTLFLFQGEEEKFKRRRKRSASPTPSLRAYISSGASSLTPSIAPQVGRRNRRPTHCPLSLPSSPTRCSRAIWEFYGKERRRNETKKFPIIRPSASG